MNITTPEPRDDVRDVEEHQPPTVPTLEALAAATADELVAARWQEGLDRWGDAFVAFSKLRLPEFHTDEVAQTFVDLYAGSFADLAEAAKTHIDALGWTRALAQLRAAEGIDDELLVWNLSAFIAQLSYAYEFIYQGGKVHLFAK